MKTWPPLPHPADAPQVRRRLPAFHPVPVGPRKDGWTPARQAALVGYLAETRSVEGACRRVGMGKESAYRLRKRRGAAGFAAAWDAALGKPRSAVDLASAKSTGLDAEYRCRMGLLVIVMERGRFAGSYWKEDNNALLQHLAQLDRAAGARPTAEEKPRWEGLPDASTPGVDFADDADCARRGAATRLAFDQGPIALDGRSLRRDAQPLEAVPSETNPALGNRQ